MLKVQVFFEELNVEYIAERISYEVSDRASFLIVIMIKDCLLFLKYIELYFKVKGASVKILDLKPRNRHEIINTKI